MGLFHNTLTRTFTPFSKGAMFKISIEASPMKGDPVPSRCVAAARMFELNGVKPNDAGKLTLTICTPLKF
jgi:hypothetical protein